MNSKLFLILTYLLVLFFDSGAKSVRVENSVQFREEVKKLNPGDSLVLANGVWQNVQLVFKGKGQEGNYIHLTAETPGKVLIEGNSSLRFSGEWLSISGLVFVHGSSPGKAVIEFRTNSSEYANNSILTNCVIDHFNQESKDKTDHWVGIWGKKNKVEYCYFGGKTNTGTTLVVWPNDSNCTNNGHIIRRNYFGPRPNLGKNGGESVRIGTSDVCRNNSGSIIESNYFEQCDGEIEIISNKSEGNLFINNTFFECAGSLVLRHGNNAVVSGNWFIGNGKESTGGIRVINEGHLICNNYFIKLRGKEFSAPLAIMNAIPDSPREGYAAVRNVMITNNTFVDCTTPLNFGVGAGKRNCTVKPEKTILVNNLVYSPDEDEVIKNFDRTDGIKLDHNLFSTRRGSFVQNMQTSAELEKVRINGIEIVYTTARSKNTETDNKTPGTAFSGSFIGAYQEGSDESSFHTADSINCGPLWYKKQMRDQINLQTDN
jgi:poly(beta-D-mannuronate) lyase